MCVCVCIIRMKRILRLFTNYRRMPPDMIFRWFVCCKMHNTCSVLMFRSRRTAVTYATTLLQFKMDVQNGSLNEQLSASKESVVGIPRLLTSLCLPCKFIVFSCEYSARRPLTMPTYWRRPRRIPKTSRDG